MAAFALAHVMYAAAFGFEKSWWKAGVLIAFYAIAFWKIVTKNVEGVLVPAIGIYACIIGLMMWRAISRLHDWSDLQTSWTNICSCVGKSRRLNPESTVDFSIARQYGVKNM